MKNRDKCPLEDNELCEKVEEWVTKLCSTGGRAWSLQIPVNFKEDPDILISELSMRFKEALTKISELNSEIEKLRK